MKSAILVHAFMLTCLCTSAALVQAQTPETPRSDLPYEVRTVEVQGASLRYLDFGGDGLPVGADNRVVTAAETEVERELAAIVEEFRGENDRFGVLLARFDGHGPTVHVAGDIRADDHLRLGSVSKVFLSYMVLREGVDPDSTIDAFYPGASHPQADAITVRMLLNHSSGIPDEMARRMRSLGEDVDPGEALRAMQDLVSAPAPPADERIAALYNDEQGFDFEPGTMWCYSNTGYYMLGRMLERSTGLSAEELLSRHFHEVAPSLYIDDGRSATFPDSYIEPWPIHWSRPWVAGAVISTAAEAVAAFHYITHKPEFERMQEWVELPVCPVDIVAGDQYGLGLQRYMLDGVGEAVGHDGHIIARSLLFSLGDTSYLIHTTRAVTNPELRAIAERLLRVLPVEKSGAGSSRGPIIDMHIHAGPGNPQAQAYDVGVNETADEARFRATLEEMDQNGVVLAMLSGPLAHTQLNRAAAPERFIAGMAFPCTDGLGPNLEQCFPSGDDFPDVEWLRGEIEAGQVGALGELYNVYAGVSPLDSRMEAYWTLAAELDIPVAVHADRGPPPAARPEGCCPHFEGDYGNPPLLKAVLERHPALRLYLMHTVNPEFVSAAIELMDAYPNVYVDTSPMSLIPEFAVHAALRRMVEAGHADRIMFGSDYLGAIGRSLEVIEAADFLTSEQKRAIFYDNAARFLRLNVEEIERHHQQVSVTRK